MADVKQKYIDKVASQIIEAIENGTAPWMKEWSGATAYAQAPINAKSENHYNGMNALNLMLVADTRGYTDPRWMTYKQASEMGYQVNKGERGTQIQYYKFGEEKPKIDENGNKTFDPQGNEIKEFEKYKNPRVFSAIVFNAHQVDGITLLQDWTPPPLQFEPNELAEKILINCGANIENLAQDSAYYSPNKDKIYLPLREQFETQAGYYATALHELAHWTGHSSRLNRDLSDGFGSEGYAKEEPRAEISSFMLSTRIGVDFNPNYPNRHFAYIENWANVIRDTPTEIFKATSDAEKITNFIEAFSREKERLEEINENILNTEQSEKETKNINIDDIDVEGKHITFKTNSVIATPRLNGVVEKIEPMGLVVNVDGQQYELRKLLDIEIMTTERVKDDITPLQKQTYLYVPYTEKELAKGVGCQYDVENKAWYAPVGTDENSIKEWLPANQTSKYTPPSTTESKENPIISFRDEMLKRGWELQGEPIADGKFHRVKTAEDKSGQKSGSYAIHNDGVPMLILTDFKQGTQDNIRIDTNYIPTEADKKVFTALNEISRIKQIQNNIDIKETQAEVSEKITKELSDMVSLDKVKTHPYLVAKGFGNNIEALSDPKAKIDSNNNLVIPFCSDMLKMKQSITTVQRIHENKDGTFVKMWEKGGEKQGSFHHIRMNGLENGISQIIVCEGYSTGLTISQAANKNVFVAGDAGNIKSVVEKIVEYADKENKTANIIIAADNDLHRGAENNTGVIKAKEAMSYIIEKYPHMSDKITVAIPSFTSEEIKNKATDFNDLHQSRGLQTVKNQIDIAILRLDKPQTKEVAPDKDKKAEVKKEKPQAKVQSKGVER